LRPSVAAAALVAAFALVAGWNAYKYPSGAGYDVRQHREYADLLIHHGEIPGPETRSEYYTPPLFYALAGAATVVGEHVHAGDPHKLGQLLNWLVLLATAGVLWLLARELFPQRPWLHLSALAFFCFLPVVLRVGAMFHPEPLGMLVTAGAMLVLALMVRGEAYSWKLASCLSVLLGLGQLVRAWSLWMVAVAVVVLATVAILDRTVRRSALRAAAVALALAVIVPLPWYVHQATRYSNPVFDRPQESGFLLSRRPLAFYVDAGYPDIVFRPWQGHLNDRFIGVLYSETWGDYFGIWAWGPGRGDRTDAIDASLVRQSVLGLLPTALALAGLLSLLGLAVARPREDVARLIVVLPPLAALASVLYLGVAYPTSDGDTVKGTYALAAVPAFALCFGFAFDVLARRRFVGLALALLLGVSALAMLPFLVW